MLRAALALTFVLAAAPAMAQTPVPDSENGRYTFSQVPEGLLRLDTRNGHVSICAKRTVGWACQIVPDERAALETEITRLQRETVALKQELISRGLSLPEGSRLPDKSAEKSNDLVFKLPSDAEFERAMTFFEKMWKRLLEMVQTLQREQDKKSGS